MSFDSDAQWGNDRIAIRELALEILRQNVSFTFTMKEAVEQARKELGL